MATAPSPNDLTRQQLDELDALLQRMLSVPLTPAETPAPANRPGGAPQPTAWRAEPPAPPPEVPPPPAPPPPVIPPSLALALETVPVPVPPPAPVPAPPVGAKPAAVPPPPPAAVKPVAKATPAPEPPAPAPAEVPLASVPEAAPAPLTPPPTATAGLTPPPAAPPVPFPLLPLAALNALFDRACGLLGAPGRVLCSGLFKHIYGAIGVGLLVYTAAHVGQLRGLITLPVQLPWPR